MYQYTRKVNTKMKIITSNFTVSLYLFLHFEGRNCMKYL